MNKLHIYHVYSPQAAMKVSKGMTVICSHVTMGIIITSLVLVDLVTLMSQMDTAVR